MNDYAESASLRNNVATFNFLDSSNFGIRDVRARLFDDGTASVFVHGSGFSARSIYSCSYLHGAEGDVVLVATAALVTTDLLQCELTFRVEHRGLDLHLARTQVRENGEVAFDYFIWYQRSLRLHSI